MISNIQHIIPDNMTQYHIKKSQFQYKEMWFLLEGDDNYKAGSIVAAITLDNEFLCYDEYRNEIVKFNRKEKIKKLQNDW
jgi:hypothetical protein